MSKTRRIIVCGGRTYADRHRIETVLAEETEDAPFVRVVHGDQKGADRLAANIAEHWGFHVEPHPAPISRYGSPAAFHIRNQEMVDAGADLCIAFPGGSGTKDLLRRARKAEIPVREIP